MGSSTAPPLRSICNYKGRVKARVKASQNPARGPQFPIWVPSNPERGPVKSRAGSRQIPSGVPSNSERGPVKFRAGPCMGPCVPCQVPRSNSELRTAGSWVRSMSSAMWRGIPRSGLLCPLVCVLRPLSRPPKGHLGRLNDPRNRLGGRPTCQSQEEVDKTQLHNPPFGRINRDIAVCGARSTFHIRINVIISVKLA